jgi:hypothetical protein
MRKPVKTYAERSAERTAARQEPWERPMARIIADNYEAIKRDIPRIGTIGVIKLLEAERQDHFDAFLNDREREANARLGRNPLDAEARRQLAAVESARRNPPFEAFKMASFSQALHHEGKNRRQTGTDEGIRAARSRRSDALASINVLKSVMVGASSDPTEAPHNEPPRDTTSGDVSGGDGEMAPSPPAGGRQDPPDGASDEVQKSSQNSGEQASESRAAASPQPASPPEINRVGETPQTMRPRGPRVPRS